jgi:hypothetical protein
MAKDCPGTYGDDCDPLRKCEAAVWFELVDRQIQRRTDRADCDVRKAENPSIYHKHASRGLLRSGMTYPIVTLLLRKKEPREVYAPRAD